MTRSTSPGLVARLNRGISWLLFPKDATSEEKARGRLVFAMVCVSLAFVVIAGRLVMLAVVPEAEASRPGRAQEAVAMARPDIVDRNGEILATDVKTASLFAEPRRIIDVDEAVEQLIAVVPDLNRGELRQRLSTRRGFVWLKREITPAQQREIHRRGIPGIGFLREKKRIYPNGPVVSHVIGHVNIDNEGIAGLERWIDGQGLADLHRAGFAIDRTQAPVQLALDLRVQHAMRDELIAAQARHRAIAAAGVIVDVDSGEILSMVSVPDYDPNDPAAANDEKAINRLTTGVFEMGSTLKALTVAMALDSGRMNLNSTFDARHPLRYGSFEIDDYRGQRRVMDTTDVFVHSSNIGTARMALALGVDHHREFLRRLGQLDRLRTELPESTAPIVPPRWGELNTVTISFGHGLSVAPLQAVMATAATVNGGWLVPPTFLRRSPEEARAVSRQVLQPSTSQAMRFLMRVNSERGTGRRADVEGFYVGGKTGTSEKVVNRRYAKDKLLTSFMAVFPADRPRYLILVMLDEPKGTPETHGFATAGWNASPTTGRIIQRVAPMLGLEPRRDLPPAEQLILARAPRPAR